MKMGIEDKVLNKDIIEKLKFYAGMRHDYAVINDERKYKIDDIVFGIVNKIDGKEASNRMYYLREYYKMAREK